MRFTLSSSALSGKLTALSRVINSKNALPILGDFVFEIKDNILYLTASDSENMMKTQLDLTDSDGYCRFAIGNHDLAHRECRRVPHGPARQRLRHIDHPTQPHTG